MGVAEEKSTTKKLQPDALQWEDNEDPVTKDNFELFDERPPTLNEWLNDVPCKCHKHKLVIRIASINTEILRVDKRCENSEVYKSF